MDQELKDMLRELHRTMEDAYWKAKAIQSAINEKDIDTSEVPFVCFPLEKTLNQVTIYTRPDGDIGYDLELAYRD